MTDSIPIACPLCTTLASCAQGTHALHIASLETCEVILGDNQGCLGWCVCVLREHVEHLDLLSTQQQAAIFADVASVARVVRAWSVAHGPAFGLRDHAPPRINYECLGNVVAHVHWHVIPRHADDPEPKAPVWHWPRERLESSLPASTRTEIARQLRALFA